MSGLIERELDSDGKSKGLQEQYATFYVDGLLFGIDVMQVQEIIRYQTLTPVPLAPPVIEGLINLRGQIITAIDLRRRLGLKPADEELLPMNVVIRSEAEVVSVLVDQIGDVLEVEAAQFESTPESLDRDVRSLVKGVYKLEDDLMLVLDIAAAVNVKTLQ